MKMLKYSLILLAPLGSLSAAVTTFNSLTADAPLTAEAGWSLSEANPAGAPIAFVGILNGSPSGALGGELNDMAVSSSTARLTMTSSLTSQYATVGMDLLIKDSTNSYPTRDAFGIGIANGSGATIVTLNFLPVAQSFTPSVDIGQWRLSYLLAGGGEVLTDFYFNELQLLNLSVVFANNTASISVGGSTFGGNIAGFDAATNGVGNISFSWTKGGSANGDNTMYFDNISVEPVPEPSAILLSGLASVFLLKRRRK